MNIEGLRTVLSISNEMKAIKQGHIPKGKKTVTYDKLELSTQGIRKSDKMMSESMLDRLNFDYFSIGVTPYSVIADGVEYSFDQIPEVPIDRCKEIRAVDNVIDIQSGNYYKFNDVNGKAHKLACTNNDLCCPYSYFEKKMVDEESSKLGFFWKLLSRHGLYYGLYFTKDEVNNYLEQAGIQKGFFTVKCAGKQQDYLYTDVRSGNTELIPRSQYDSDYKGITGQAGEIGTYYDNKPGAVFEIDGEKYTVSERGTLDIPYGINIYDVKKPPKSELKEKYQ